MLDGIPFVCPTFRVPRSLITEPVIGAPAEYRTGSHFPSVDTLRRRKGRKALQKFSTTPLQPFRGREENWLRLKDTRRGERRRVLDRGKAMKGLEIKNRDGA